MRDLRNWVRNNLVWFAGLLVVVIGGLAYVQTIVETRQATDRIAEATACQSSFNEAFAAALSDRAAAAAAERATADVARAAQQQVNRAQRNLIITVMGNAEQDPAVQQESYQVFLGEIDRADEAINDATKARTDADLTRQQHPIPTNRC